MMMKYKKILVLVVMSLGLWSGPLASQADEYCCVCTVRADDLIDTDLGVAKVAGPPTNSSCSKYEGQASEGGETLEIKCDAPKQGSCSEWQKAVDKVNSQQAAADSAEAYKRSFVIPQLQISIPGLSKFGVPTEVEVGTRKYYFVTWLGEYLNGIYRFAVGAGAVLAVVMIIVGGFIWLTSTGNQAMIGVAKGYIGGAIVGVIILLGSYIILQTLSPSLTNLQPIRLAKIGFEEVTASISDDELQAYSQSTTGSYTPPKAVAGMTTFNAPNGQGLTLSNTIANDVQQILQQIHGQGFPLSFGGASSYRPTSNCVQKPNFSWHGCGLAIDINPAENPCPCCYQEGKKWSDCKEKGSDWKPGKTSGAVTKQVVDAFKAKGFCWGGDWCNFKDFMHFSKPTNAGSKECPGSANYCPWVW